MKGFHPSRSARLSRHRRAANFAASAVLIGVTLSALAAESTPLLGVWRGFDRSDASHVMQQTLTYRADGTFESELIVANTGSQYVYSRGRYRVTGPSSMEVIVDWTGICMFGQSLSSCLPNAATPVGVLSPVAYQIEGSMQLKITGVVYHRVQ